MWRQYVTLHLSVLLCDKEPYSEWYTFIINILNVYFVLANVLVEGMQNHSILKPSVCYTKKIDKIGVFMCACLFIEILKVGCMKKSVKNQIIMGQ